MELHETRMGRKLIEADLPRAIRALEQIAEALEKLNKPITYKYNLKNENNGLDERSLETNAGRGTEPS